jgi:hypothetical protein
MISGEKRLFETTYLIVGVMLLLRLVPLVFPNARMWGFNHLMFLPQAYTAAFIVLAIIAMSLPFLSSAMSLGSGLSIRFSRLFYESPRKYIYRGIVAGGWGAIFILFAMPTHFLGDGYLQLRNLATQSGIIHKWSEAGITLILEQIQVFLGAKDLTTARTAYQLVSFLSGIISICFFFLIASEISADRSVRVLAFLTAFFSGTLLLFFGYVETYPLLWIFMTGYIYFALRRLNGKGGLIAAGLFLALGIFIHLQMAVLIPSYIFLIFAEGKGYAVYRRYRYAILSIFFLLAIISISAIIWKLETDLHFRSIFLPLLRGKPAYPEYGLISLPHLIDILNLVMLISPAIAFMIAFSIGNPATYLKGKGRIFLAFVSLPYLLFLLAVDPQLAMPRDWDLFSLSLFGPALLFLHALPAPKAPILERMMPTLIIFLVCSTAPFILTNIGQRSAAAYMEYMIDLDRPKSLSSLTTLRNYYRDQGNQQKVDSLNALYGTYFPNQRRMQEALSALKEGNRARALYIAEQVKPDEFSSDYHNFMSTLHLGLGEYNQALGESDKAIQLQRYNYRYYMTRGWIYASLKDTRKAIDAFRTAYHLSNSNPEIIESLISLHLADDNSDSAFVYAERLAALDSTNVSAFYWLAKIYSRNNLADSAETYRRLYFERGRFDPLFKFRSAELLGQGGE